MKDVGGKMAGLEGMAFFRHFCAYTMLDTHEFLHQDILGNQEMKFDLLFIMFINLTS